MTRLLRCSLFQARILTALLAICATVPAYADAPTRAEFEGEAGWIDLLEQGFHRWVVEGKNRGAKIQPPGVWTVSDDGVLRCDGRGFGFLRYDEEFADFCFSCEYQISASGNSGVGIRGVPYVNTLASRPSRAAYELQILDGPAEEVATGNMALYKLVPALASPDKPAGEWNLLQVACAGPHIRVWLNGELVQDVNQSQRPEISDRRLTGYLQLQNHHSVVAFRNLRLRVLAQ